MTGKRHPAKETLDTSISEMAVLGGTVLGSGGGGRLEAGLRLGQLTAELGEARLIDVDGLPADANLAAIATFCTSAGDETQYRLFHHKRAIQLLAANVEVNIAGLVNCGSGAVDTMAGWAQAALLGIPLVDAALGQGVHPSAGRGLLELWLGDAIPLSLALVSGNGGDGERLEVFSQGSPRLLIQMLKQSVDRLGGNYALAIGPLPQPWLKGRVDPHLISRAIEIGNAMMGVADDRGWATATAVGRTSGGQVATFGSITDIAWHGSGSKAYGVIRLRDEHDRPAELTFWHRFVALDVAEERVATFPDLIVTLGARGTPLGGVELARGQDVYIVTAPNKRRASRGTCRWRETYCELEEITDQPMLPFLDSDEWLASGARDLEGEHVPSCVHPHHGYATGR
jgi:DUF917 family protein